MSNLPARRMLPLLLWTAACTTALTAAAPDPVRSEQELRGFYARACVGCHGIDGSALAPDGAKLKGRDLTAHEALRGTSDATLAKTIRQGLFFGLSMPAYKQELTQEEALILVRDILRKARKGEPILPQAAEPKRAQAAPANR